MPVKDVSGNVHHLPVRRFPLREQQAALAIIIAAFRYRVHGDGKQRRCRQSREITRGENRLEQEIADQQHDDREIPAIARRAALKFVVQ